MLVQAVLIGFIAMFVTFEWMLGTNLGSRPIITGVLVGLVMGDLKTGIILGATLEMVFIGSITLGAAVPPDVITGGILGAAFAISTGKGADVALALAFPIATLYLVVDNLLTLVLLPVFVHKADRYVEEGEFRKMEMMHILGGFVVKSLPRGIICAAAFYLGTPVMNRVLESIPEFVQNGLVAAAGFIPAWYCAADTHDPYKENRCVLCAGLYNQRVFTDSHAWDRPACKCACSDTGGAAGQPDRCKTGGNGR